MDEIWVRNSDAEFSAILVKFLRQSDEFKFVFSHTDAYKLQILKQTLEQIFHRKNLYNSRRCTLDWLFESLVRLT